jgi:hypothetical protein
MCVLGCVCIRIHTPSRVTIYYAYFLFRVCFLTCLNPCLSTTLSLLPVTYFTESCVCVRVCSRLTTLQAKLEKEIDRLSKGHVYVEAGVHVVRPGTTF